MFNAQAANSGARDMHIGNDLDDIFGSMAAITGEPSPSRVDKALSIVNNAAGNYGEKGATPTSAKARKRPKKAERELNEVLLFLANVGDKDEAAVPAIAPAEATQKPAQAAKPRKKATKKTLDQAASVEQAPEQETEPELEVPVVAPRRKLRMEHTWFDPDELPTAVPYAIRYYLSQPDGHPIVSWREPEASDAQSNLPQGTLFENGARVNPAGKVDKPEDRRANTACEFCKYR